MTPEDRISQLETELRDTQRAAVDLVLRLMDGYRVDAESRERVARMLITLSAVADTPSQAELARLVADALRRRGLGRAKSGRGGRSAPDWRAGDAES